MLLRRSNGLFGNGQQRVECPPVVVQKLAKDAHESLPTLPVMRAAGE
jgi:hypothetical protein